MWKKHSRSDRWGICDVCGFKYHVRDLIGPIEDRYNRHYGLVVCRKDRDPTNQQDIPYKYKETIVSDLKKIRTRPSAVYIVNPNDNRAPSAPQNGLTVLDSLSSTINLYWDGPSDTGSSGIIGYRVQVANPQFANYVDLSTNTGINTTFYQDSTTPLTNFVSYRVAAINSFGQGPYSVEFFWPSQQITAEVVYIGLSDGADVLADSAGNPIIYSPEV